MHYSSFRSIHLRWCRIRANEIPYYIHWRTTRNKIYHIFKNIHHVGPHPALYLLAHFRVTFSTILLFAILGHLSSFLITITVPRCPPAIFLTRFKAGSLEGAWSCLKWHGTFFLLITDFTSSTLDGLARSLRVSSLEQPNVIDYGLSLLLTLITYILNDQLLFLSL